MTHALITGGAGFIGSHLSEALLADGYEVSILDDLSTGRQENVDHLLDNPRFSQTIGSITDAVTVDELVARADVVFHLAAVVGVDLIIKAPLQVIQTNVRGTEIVLDAANRHCKQTLIASTSEVYGKSDDTPFNEDADSVIGATKRSRWSYAVTKALDEFLALAYHAESDLPVTIFRLFNTVGPRQRGHYGMVIPRFVKWALAGEPIQVYGDGQQSRCFANVRDAVKAIVGLSQTPAANGEVFNVGSQEEITILDLAERVKAHAASSSEIQLIPYEQAYDEGFEDMRRRVPDTDKIKRVTGWQTTTSLDETLDQVIAYFRSR